jgi:hypothetical protein
VKLVRTTKNRLLFRLSRQEKDLLLAVLELYPCIPDTYQPLSKSSRSEESNQQLLDESLAEHRAGNQKQLEALLTDRKKLVETKTGWRLALSPSDVEWLLQILNDIRVGSWATLGSPEECVAPMNAATLPHIWAMNVSGALQMELLEELEGGT